MPSWLTRRIGVPRRRHRFHSRDKRAEFAGCGFLPRRGQGQRPRELRVRLQGPGLATSGAHVSTCDGRIARRGGGRYGLRRKLEAVGCQQPTRREQKAGRGFAHSAATGIFLVNASGAACGRTSASGAVVAAALVARASARAREHAYRPVTPVAGDATDYPRRASLRVCAALSASAFCPQSEVALRSYIKRVRNPSAARACGACASSPRVAS
jgi:hypothetical protein